MSPWITRLLNLTRYQRRALLVALDICLLHIALWLAMSARYGYFYVAPNVKALSLLALVPFIAVLAYFRLGLYRHVTRHFDIAGDQLVALGASLSSLGLGLGAFLAEVDGIPRSVLFLYPLFASLLICGSRRVVRQFLRQSGVNLPASAHPHSIRNIFIYGAGDSGRALFAAIRKTPDLEVVGFFDPDPALWRQYVSGVRVFPPERLGNLARLMNINQVLMATEHASRNQRLAVLEALGDWPAEVLVIPSLEEFARGRVSINELRKVQASDLLGRPSITPLPDLMSRTVTDRNVMVTGAAGSIGSEIVRQVLNLRPSRLVLLSASENGLYEIEREATRILSRQPSSSTTQVVSILGSTNNEKLIDKVLATYAIHTFYHAAAYKHVPILEQNISVGVRNNVRGTEVVVKAVERHNVSTFVYISTDKAVRPINTLGASKRVGEMIVQAHASRRTSTTFSIVRFGNVLDSSGSIARLFRDQINYGGPLTVSHPEVTRYFISIPEAATLVIQSGAMAEGGDVFLLDMGEPVKILDLARIMIKLSGLQIRSTENPEGDIDIAFTGLRPGDKLHEELFTGAVTPTRHPRIYRVAEPIPSCSTLSRGMELLHIALENDDTRAVIDSMRFLVEDYKPFIGEK